MTPALILICFLVYTVLLFFITWLTARKANNQGFFIGNRRSPWIVVAYGMIGASLSGVTFMSVPGYVGSSQFSYMALVLGYLIGYFVIAFVLLPLYYRLNLTSIYTYLEQRFGFWAYKTGAFFFLLSRIIGASFRMFLVVKVMQIFVFDAWGIPFALTVSIFILLILLYTFEGGIKTIIWTDTVQTTFMLLAVVLSLTFIAKGLDVSFSGLIHQVVQSDYSRMWFFDWHDDKFFIKQMLGGMFITIAMTGLDQEMMQKNLSCRNLRDARKNMLSFSVVLVFVNLMFLFLGASLYIFANAKGITLPASSDDLFPTLALKYMGTVSGVIFLIGLISAAYPSADGALTALTTSFSIDFLGLNKKNHLNENQKKRIRYIVHIGFAVILLLTILLFSMINNEAVIKELFTVAGYTYGPLLGLFAFGLFSKRNVRDKWIPLVAVVSPIVCYLLSKYSQQIIPGYKVSFEMLLINGILTFMGLWLISFNNKKSRKLVVD